MYCVSDRSPPLYFALEPLQPFAQLEFFRNDYEGCFDILVSMSSHLIMSSVHINKHPRIELVALPRI